MMDIQKIVSNLQPNMRFFVESLNLSKEDETTYDLDLLFSHYYKNLKKISETGLLANKKLTFNYNLNQWFLDSTQIYLGEHEEGFVLPAMTTHRPNKAQNLKSDIITHLVHMQEHKEQIESRTLQLYFIPNFGPITVNPQLMLATDQSKQNRANSITPITGIQLMCLSFSQLPTTGCLPDQSSAMFLNNHLNSQQTLLISREQLLTPTSKTQSSQHTVAKPIPHKTGLSEQTRFHTVVKPKPMYLSPAK